MNDSYFKKVSFIFSFLPTFSWLRHMWMNHLIKNSIVSHHCLIAYHCIQKNLSLFALAHIMVARSHWLNPWYDTTHSQVVCWRSQQKTLFLSTLSHTMVSKKTLSFHCIISYHTIISHSFNPWYDTAYPWVVCWWRQPKNYLSHCLSHIIPLYHASIDLTHDMIPRIHSYFLSIHDQKLSAIAVLVSPSLLCTTVSFLSLSTMILILYIYIYI